MSLFSIFVAIDAGVSVLIFLQLILIFSVISLIYKQHLFLMLDLLIISIIGMILCFCHILNIEYSKLLYVILGIGTYLLPLLAYFDRRSYIAKKIQRCTEEVDAKIIKVYKGREKKHLVYVPKLEFKLNDKIYKFMDSTEIYFRYKEQCEVGNIIKLFVCPNPKIHSPNGCDDVFLPNSYKEYSYSFTIFIFYILTLLMFLLIIFLN